MPTERSQRSVLVHHEQECGLRTGSAIRRAGPGNATEPLGSMVPGISLRKPLVSSFVIRQPTHELEVRVVVLTNRCICPEPARSAVSGGGVIMGEIVIKKRRRAVEGAASRVESAGGGSLSQS